MTTPFLSVGTNNQINAPNAFVFGNNITVPTSTTNSNTLYLDPTITAVNAPGLITTTAANYGLVDNGGVLSVGPLTGSTITVATPTAIGGVYGLVDNGSTKTGNTGLGYNALVANTTGNNNTAIGESALSISRINGNNTAIGAGALSKFNDTTSSTPDNNVGIGYNAFTQLTLGSNNVCVGSSFNGTNALTATNTTTVGDGNLTTDTTLSLNVTIGSTNTIDTGNVVVVGNNNSIVSSAAPGALIYGNNNNVSSPCLIFGNKNIVSNSPNCIVFGLGASVSNLTAGTVYFDPKVTNFHLGNNIPLSTATTDKLVPLLLDTTSGYVYQSNVPLTLLYTDFYFASSGTATIPADGGSTTVIYNTKAIDNFYVSNTYSTSTGVFTAPVGGTYQYEYQTALSTTNTLASGLTVTVNVNYFNGSSTVAIATTTTTFPFFLNGTATAPVVNLKGIFLMANKGTLQCTISASLLSSTIFTITNSYMKVILL